MLMKKQDQRWIYHCDNTERFVFKIERPSNDDSFLAFEAVYSLLKYQDEFCLVLGELEDGMKHVGEWCDIGNRFDISNGL